MYTVPNRKIEFTGSQTGKAGIKKGPRSAFSHHWSLTVLYSWQLFSGTCCLGTLRSENWFFGTLLWDFFGTLLRCLGTLPPENWDFFGTLLYVVSECYPQRISIVPVTLSQRISIVPVASLNFIDLLVECTHRSVTIVFYTIVSLSI